MTNGDDESMNENLEDSKSKEKRLEQKEKLNAETERSLAVARMKQAHKQIEDTERTRKRSAVISLCRRLERFKSSLFNFTKSLIKSDTFPKIEVGTPFGEQVGSHVKMYESIRFDLQKILEIKNEDLEKLFPRIGVKFGKRLLVTACLLNIIDQVQDMRLYCERMLL